MTIINYEITWVELIGFTGACMILFGFYRTSIGQWKTTSFWYELDNLCGSVLLATYHILTKTYVVLVLNVLWAVVAFKGIQAYLERSGKRPVKTKRKKR